MGDAFRAMLFVVGVRHNFFRHDHLTAKNPENAGRKKPEILFVLCALCD
jgi:hypothetical protein